MSGWINDLIALTPVAFSSLPASPSNGMVMAINDGLAGNCADGS